jgi:hypothetical protein
VRICQLGETAWSLRGEVLRASLTITIVTPGRVVVLLQIVPSLGVLVKVSEWIEGLEVRVGTLVIDSELLREGADGVRYVDLAVAVRVAVDQGGTSEVGVHASPVLPVVDIVVRILVVGGLAHLVHDGCVPSSVGPTVPEESSVGGLAEATAAP